MILSTLDTGIIIFFFVLFSIIGLWVSKNAAKDSISFFLSGRNMPWWLLGVSMVATTFSADTPNLVTQLVRDNGIAGNWVWWAFLLTGMLTVFFYARLWRKSEVLTDLEFYEIRYSGKVAAFLRGFRSLYLGVFFNVIIMATVCLAAIKIGGVLFNLEDWECVLYASLITVFYSVMGGLKGVIITDFFQFILAMIGAIWAAIYLTNLPEVGGLSELVAHPEVRQKLNFFPSWNDPELVISLLVIPLTVQWWSVWYPGAEPGGGGYIAQRMLAAKDEKNALIATLLFNITHYALRPWPWIIIALASIIVFPDLESISQQFPNIDPSFIGDDIAYPLMLTKLPSGLLGVVVASLISAFMSTISTHLNWGASYFAFDFYKRFIRPESSEKELVWVGRLSIVVLMVLAGVFSLFLKDALSAFQILLQIGAGTGLIFILRWFWWRINAYSEISGMVISFIIALWFAFFQEPVFGFTFKSHEQLLLSVGLTTVVWIVITLLTKPTDTEVLLSFYKRVQPYGIGWRSFEERYINRQERDTRLDNISLSKNKKRVSTQFLNLFLSINLVYCFLLGTGMLLLCEDGLIFGGGLFLVSAILAFGLYKNNTN